MSKLKTCVCGGGHVAHALAAVMGANPDVTVRVATRRPDIWSTEIHAVHRELMVVGRPEVVTANLAVALDGAELIFVAAPAFAHLDILTRVKDFVAPHAWMGALPAPGFFDWAIRAALPCIRIFGAQRSPYNCRVTTPGREVEILGIVPRLTVAALPRHSAAELAGMLCTALMLPVEVLDNFLCVTLSPSSSIFHPARLRSLLGSWDGVTSFQRAPLLYEDWDDAASELYLRCDAELQAVCSRLPLDLSGVIPAAAHYGVASPSALTARIRSLEGLRGIPLPMRASSNGSVPDTRNRFFLEDFPFGIEAVRTLAALATVETPTLDEVDAWSRRPPVASTCRAPQNGCSALVQGRDLNAIVRNASR